MTEIITLQDLIIEIAHTWLNTPYIQGACCKDKGIDCGNIISEILKEANVMPKNYILPYFYKDWHRGKFENIDKDAFRKEFLKFGYIIPFEERQKADVISFYYNNIESHIALLVDDDCIIHAVSGLGVKKQRLKNFKLNICSVYRVR